MNIPFCFKIFILLSSLNIVLSFNFCINNQSIKKFLRVSSQISVFFASLILPVEAKLNAQYDSYSQSYDNTNGGEIASLLGFDELRATASEYLSGNVLEIAIGTGLQTKFYDQKKISSFTGIDISSGMLEKAKEKVALNLPNIPTNLELMNAESLNYQDKSFDTVVDTFSLCVIPNPRSALSEMARVVKEDGKIILLENSRSDNLFMGIFQDATEPVVTKISKNCKWNVNVDKIADEVGLKIIKSIKKDIGTISLGVYTKIKG